MFSNAKINLFLHITGKFHSGFHNLESLMIPVNICDKVNITQSDSDETKINITGEFAHLVNSTDNLVTQSIDAIFDYVGEPVPNFNIDLEKNIPAGAGLGGGSSNCATTLKMINKMMGFDLNSSTLKKIAMKIGADVPFFIDNRPALIRGVGHLETFVDVPPLNILIVFPNTPLQTKSVFTHQPIDFEDKMPITNYYQNRAELINNIISCKNSLENNSINLMPDIKNMIDAIKSQDACLIARMTGSGSSCFGIFKSRSSLKRAENYMIRNYPKWWIKAV